MDVESCQDVRTGIGGDMGAEEKKAKDGWDKADIVGKLLTASGGVLNFPLVHVTRENYYVW